MRFRVMLIIACVLTAVILFTNAKQMFFFEKANPSQSSISASNSAVTSYAQSTLLGPHRYGDALALRVSTSRATSMLDTNLSDSSCVHVYESLDNSFAIQPFINLNASAQLVPASTNKLITAAVVLSTLDPTSTLDTSLLGTKKGSTLAKGYVRTSGDPSFVTDTKPPARRPDYLSPTHVRTLADFANKTYAAGIRTITQLVIDNTWFELDSVEPGWSDDKADVGQIAALNVDEGFSGAELALDADDNGAAALLASFEAKGITVGGISFGATPEAVTSGPVISTTSSATVKDLVSDMLKTSDNVFAEQLLAAATRSKYGKVNKESRANLVNSTLDSLKIDRTGYVFVNGSGYSMDVRASCALQSSVIQKMNSLDIDLAQLSSFAGHDGTLAKRFTNLDTELHAKTGTLDGVTALTGSLGDDLSFSFISNGNFSEEGGKALQEKVVSTLNSFPFVSAPKFPASFGKE